MSPHTSTMIGLIDEMNDGVGRFATGTSLTAWSIKIRCDFPLLRGGGSSPRFLVGPCNGKGGTGADATLSLESSHSRRALAPRRRESFRWPIPFLFYYGC